MPPEAGGVGLGLAQQPAAGASSDLSAKLRSSTASINKAHKSREKDEEDHGEVLMDDQGRPYKLGPEGFVRDLNTRAVKIARRVVEQSRATEAAGGASSGRNNLDREALATAAAAVDGFRANAGTSGTLRTEVAQEIQFVLSGRLPFVKRSALLVWTSVAVALYFVVRFGLVDLGIAPTIGAFVVMYFVLDFYSGVLHVLLDDEWNMNVPLLSQPAMEFQYHHHIPDDGCSRPFVEGMGDLNVLVLIHLGLFVALYVRGGCENSMLLTAGAWKMLLAYWGIWNHRQAHQLKSKRPRWCTYLQDIGIMLHPANHKVHHTPPHDDEYCLLGVTTPLVTWIGRCNLGSFFWIAMFLLTTAFDTIAATAILRAIFA